jgi:hypothetical protein
MIQIRIECSLTSEWILLHFLVQEMQQTNSRCFCDHQSGILTTSLSKSGCDVFLTSSLRSTFSSFSTVRVQQMTITSFIHQRKKPTPFPLRLKSLVVHFFSMTDTSTIILKYISPTLGCIMGNIMFAGKSHLSLLSRNGLDFFSHSKAP